MIYVLYHAGCADGFGAALAAWLCLGEAVGMDGGLSEVRYLPVQYGKPVPALEAGCAVYLVDFCYDLAELRVVAAVARSVVVLDHHPRAAALLARAQEEMAEALPGNVDIVFDNEKSGAVLAWEFFFPREPVPLLLRYVQDRDLWQWRLPESREVAAALASYPKEFAQWGRLLDEDGVEQLREEGRVALRVERQMAERLAKQSMPVRLGPYDLPAVNTAVLISEVCHELLTEYGFPIAACWYEKEGRRIWSLRSRADVDCSVIAKRYGGGGHPQACGFEEPAFQRSTNDTKGTNGEDAGSSAGAQAIAKERQRQITEEGWAPYRDDEHTAGELVEAAVCYASACTIPVQSGVALAPGWKWPWARGWWRPSKDPMRNLVKAGALVAAEIDRLLRRAKSAEEKS